MPVVNAAVTVWARRYVILVLGGLLIAAVTFAIITQYKSQNSVGRVLELSDQKINLEIADNPEERSKGLSDRDSLPGHSGMLFIFEEPGKYCFWMKDTRIPLDIIWLDADQQVVHVKYDARPESYPESFCPPSAASEVVELNAGSVPPQSIMIGQRLHY